MTVSEMSPVQVTDEQIKHYRDEGYCILERAIPPAQLEMLRDECQHFIDVINAEMDAEGVQEFEDTSSWSDDSYSASGGEATFEIEAENEDDARDRANNLISTELSLRSRDDMEWEINDVSIDSIEEITEFIRSEFAAQGT